MKTFLGKSEDSFLGKFIRCPGKFRKILNILRGTLRKILKKRKVNFDKIFGIKKCIPRPWTK